MPATLQQAQHYAALKKTKVFDTVGGHKLHEDGSITFVLESGPKLTMTEKELSQAISELEGVREEENKAMEWAPTRASAEVKLKSAKYKKGD